jgi:hypothetical protein
MRGFAEDGGGGFPISYMESKKAVLKTPWCAWSTGRPASHLISVSVLFRFVTFSFSDGNTRETRLGQAVTSAAVF